MSTCPTPTKQRFRNRSKALFSLQMIRRKTAQRATQVRGVYECECGGWHLTHKAGMPTGVRLRKSLILFPEEGSGSRYRVIASPIAQGWSLRCDEVPEAVLDVRDLEDVRHLAGVIARLEGLSKDEVRIRLEVR